MSTRTKIEVNNRINKILGITVPLGKRIKVDWMIPPLDEVNACL